MSAWVLTAIHAFLIFVCMRKAIEEGQKFYFWLYLAILFVCELYTFRQYDVWETAWKACMMTALGGVFAYIFHLMVMFDRKREG